MDLKLLIISIRQGVIELRDEMYQKEKNGIAKATLNFIDLLESNEELKLLNALDGISGLQKIHGNIIKTTKIHSGCISIKFEDKTSYKIKIEKSNTAVLDCLSSSNN